MHPRVRSIACLSLLLTLSACRAGGKLMGGALESSLETPSNSSILEGAGATGDGVQNTNLGSTGTATDDTLQSTADTLDAMQRTLHITQTVDTIDTPTYTPGAGANAIVSSGSAEALDTSESGNKEAVTHSCTDYLPTDAEVIAITNLKDFDKSILSTQMPDLIKLLPYIKELCFAIKYPQPEAVKSISSTSTYSFANMEPSQSLSLLQGDSFSSDSLSISNQPSSGSMSSSISNLNASQLEASTGTSVQDQVTSAIGSLVVVAIANDEKAAGYLMKICKEREAEDVAAGKTAYACLQDGDIVLSGNKLWADAMMSAGHLIPGYGHRLAALFAGTRTATLKIAGDMAEQLQKIWDENFTKMGIRLEPETAHTFMLGFTASVAKIYAHLRVQVGLDPVLEPDFEALLFFTPSPSFSLFQSSDSSVISNDIPYPTPEEPAPLMEVQQGEQAPLNLLQ